MTSVSGYHHSSAVVTDKQSAAQLLTGPAGGLPLRKCGEASMARGHLDYKFECVRTMRVFWQQPMRDQPAHQHWHLRSFSVPSISAEGDFYFCPGRWESALAWTLPRASITKVRLILNLDFILYSFTSPCLKQQCD